ncbi:hypothetical protein [Microcystis phage Mwe-JY25]
MSAPEPMDLPRLEQALAVAAYVVLRHGPLYAPIMERLRDERDAMARSIAGPEGEARRLLAQIMPGMKRPTRRIGAPRP